MQIWGNKYIVLDLETDGLDCHKDAIVSVAMCSKGKEFFSLVYHKDNNLLPQVCLDTVDKKIDKADIIVGHNIKFDLKFLYTNKVNSIKFKNIWDTSVAEYILTNQQTKLVKLADLIKKYSNTKEKIKINLEDIKASEYSGEVLKEYNLQDVRITEIIFLKQFRLAQQLNLVNLIFVCSNFSKILADIEVNGMYIDKQLLETHSQQLQEKITQLEIELKSYIPESKFLDFNLSSHEHVSVILFGGFYKYKGDCELSIGYLKNGSIKLNKKQGTIPVFVSGLGFSKAKAELTKNGYHSASGEVITTLKGKTKIQKKFIEKYKLYRKLVTLNDKYYSKYTKYLQDNFLYANYNQTVTETGRLSCNNPNLQQIPRADDTVGDFQIKSLFKSRYADGYILDVDLSQLEWRVCAFLCKDKTMIQEIRDKKDAHKNNAALAFNVLEESVTKEMRQIAKAVSFGLIYGQTARGLANRVDIPINTEEEAKKIIDVVYNKYSRLQIFHNKLYIQAVKNKKIINPTGRGFVYQDPDREFTKIKNYPVQSLATADIAPLLFWRVWEYLQKNKNKLGIDFNLVNTVHDCLVFDCKDMHTVKTIAKVVLAFFRNADKLIKKYFNIDFNIPLDGEAEFGKNWKDLQALHL